MKLNLGSGNKYMYEYINIDFDPSVKADKVIDIAKDGLRGIHDNSCSEVRAFDFLEHLPLGRTIFVIEEIYRVLKIGGKFEHFTPSTEGMGAFQDPTHLSFWNINSWYYFCPEMVGGRKFYNIKAQFRIDLLRDIETDARVVHTHGIMRKY